ncbi:hypothetical protein SteCoe_11232 [Stentor coeruleus]|uniref:Uncharacterized protein n=1 Tax=Stentor coeruleus TaxID=5963 RepID=A0A1R2CDI1_9CILI|nr:hypothetical protein SteCoe_11232 [Stentor coeruleus]
MNKYSILKSSSYQHLYDEDIFQSLSTLRAASPSHGISSYAMNENLQYSQASPLQSSEISYNFPQIKTLPKLPYRDYNTLLSKLDIITSTKPILNKDFLLNENDQLDFYIEESALYHIKIPSAFKQSPLRVLIKRNCGKIITYLSLSNQKPSHTNHDQVYNTDYFEFRSSERFFRCEFVYLGIKALTNSKLTLLAYFGKNRGNLITKQRSKKTILEHNYDINIDEPAISRVKSEKLKRNFIEKNLNLRILSPRVTFRKTKDWVCKRELALIKKKLLLEEKKSKALVFINRKQIRIENLKDEKKKEQVLQNKQFQIYYWLKTIYAYKAVMIFNKMIWDKRNKKTLAILMNIKARTLQKAYRKSTKNYTINQLISFRGLKLIQFYYATTKDFARKSVEKTLVNFICQTAKTYQTFNKIASFYRRVIKIQKAFREYLIIRNARIRNLIILWDQCKAFEIRRSLKKKKLMLQLNVSIYQRKVILDSYYLQCVRNYYKDDRERQAELFLELKYEKKFGLGRGSFKYIPLMQDMKKMIEDSRLVSDRNYYSGNLLEVIR